MNDTGRILKGIGSFYDVISDTDGQVYVCRPRGKFRIQQGGKPMVGDRVRFQPPTTEDDGYLLELLPRSNRLKRPPVSNIDRLVVVMSAGKPQADLLLIDRLLCTAHAAGIDSAICINKCDTADPDTVAELARQYRHLPLFQTNAMTGEGVAALAAFGQGAVMCLAGQSGVGKSSLINALCPELTLETGDVSQKIGRGKHTTRLVQLLPLPAGGYIVDTPGFSLLEAEMLDPQLLMTRYPDFAPYTAGCRFIGCVHDREPDCTVKAAVEEGLIDADRYERYRTLLHELQENWRNRYD